MGQFSHQNEQFVHTFHPSNAYKVKLCVKKGERRWSIFTHFGRVFRVKSHIRENKWVKNSAFWSRIWGQIAYKGKNGVKTHAHFLANNCHKFRHKMHIRENKWPFFTDLCAVFWPFLHIRGNCVTFLVNLVTIILWPFLSRF